MSTISGAMVLHAIAKGVEPHRAVLLPNWVDLAAIQPQPESQRAANPYRRELGIDAKQRVLLYSGSMNKKQGLELLVEAIERLADVPDLVWLLAGEGPSKAELAAATAEMANVRQVSEIVPSIGCTVWHAQLVRLSHSTAGPAE